MDDGTTVKLIDTKNLYVGCGNTYVKVKYVDPDTGLGYKGYIGFDYVSCGSTPAPRPGPAPNPQPVDLQKCSSFAVKYGGTILSISLTYYEKKVTIYLSSRDI